MFSNIGNTQTIILLRHATAIKNEENKHGGKGSELADCALDEIQNVVNQLLRFSAKFDNILYAPRKHCEQTAKKLSKQLNINAIVLEEIEPIDLGIVDGLTQEEVMSLYPEIGLRLAKWRNGEIEINQLEVPQMTDCHVFYNKGKAFTENLINSKKSVITITDFLFTQ